MPTNITGLPAVVAGATRGVEASSPPNITQHKSDPTPTDYYNFNTGDLWLNSQPNVQTPANSIYKVWLLAGKANHIAKWIPFINGGAGTLVSLTGNTGGTVFGDVNQNINTIGDNVGIVAVGNPATNTITFSLKNGGSAIIGLQPDLGAVVSPIAGIINIHNPPIAIDGNILTQNGTINGDPANYLDLRLADSISVTNNGLFGFRNNAGGGVAAYNPTNTVNQFNMSVNTFNAGANSSGFNIVKGRGTASAPTVIISGDTLGELAFEGFVSGANQVIGAAIRSVSSGTIAVNRVAANLILSTHPDSVTAVTPIDRMIIASDGTTTINAIDGPANFNYTLNVGYSYPNSGLFVSGSSVAGPANSIVAQDDTNGFIIMWNLSTTAGNAGNIQCLRTRPAAAAVVSGDTLGTFSFAGYTGNVGPLANVTGASITSVSSGTIAANRLGANLSFNTHRDVATGLFPVSRMTISSEGNVVINAPNSGVALTSIATFGQVVGGTGIPVVVDNAGLFGTVVSSARYKENIQDMGYESSPIMKLRPVTFNYKSDDSKSKSFGLISEEVAEVFPYLAVKDSDGHYITVKYHEMSAILLNEIQKLNKRISELEKKCTV